MPLRDWAQSVVDKQSDESQAGSLLIASTTSAGQVYA